ncbi:hypothetical protein WJX73_008482 [Symbiochloris irregularis]|uniref:DUF924-domain-containing protein n=1 Tax=Symbiochloris irregularis TaxID=706552 RepID=A0AAW1PIQ1_9CHLO
MATSSRASAAHDLDPRAEAILKFWVGDSFLKAGLGAFPQDKTKLWFMSGPEVDEEIRAKFGGDLRKAAAGEMDSWRGYNGLAAVILQDQLARNFHRGTPEMYAYDERALALAEILQEDGSLAGTPIIHRFWLALPMMHCESLAGHELGIRFSKTLQKEAEALGPPPDEGLMDIINAEAKHAESHKACIEQWGRYPHRNKLLGRPNTPEEEQGFKDNAIPAW